MAHLTVREVIRSLEEPVGVLEKTVDTLKCGSPDRVVTGIVTAFMPTQHVLEQAAALGANLVVAHEGAYYSHHDPADFLEQDPVYLEKRQWIEASGLAIYRFHDYWHRYRPDGIMTGLLQSLGWEEYVVEDLPAATILEVPALTLGEAAEVVKSRLGLAFVRVSGDLSTPCTRIGLLAGYRGGGGSAIPLFGKGQVDLIIAGEGPEWETPEYVRDAVHQGRPKGLIMLGHAESEEPGMRYLAELLQRRFPEVPVHFLADKPVFRAV
ncbi:NGG1-interacting factor 3 [Paenibacillus mucilaginosus 3016]|uniref:GTP cyclohydrolase 1 type 2 homolog n=2 Tax=Paenibacillus mucilaginosus TaxID=61624 RepID=H6NKU7_9BACL|nr:Nif3-like dinuclear metal center hexameric protein [Paenibacillus mucilaginosus]AFC29253.1 NGG1-interacting factor 3 [Paenibacillus mucilaginosus 3016]AFH61432.1 transcriptional regulator [Paenibacillus mucilaginosus K02]WFA17979.1 transcriptional regulator [Paenibacillus mucilaginosus]